MASNLVLSNATKNIFNSSKGPVSSQASAIKPPRVPPTGMAQAKPITASLQSIGRTSPPPVYRPSVTQGKQIAPPMGHAPSVHSTPATHAKTGATPQRFVSAASKRSAPPVYRPSVLQGKQIVPPMVQASSVYSTLATHGKPGAAPQRFLPAAPKMSPPPVYRPSVVQGKQVGPAMVHASSVCSTSPTHAKPGVAPQRYVPDAKMSPPPVYRPSAAQGKQASVPHARFVQLSAMPAPSIFRTPAVQAKPASLPPALLPVKPSVAPPPVYRPVFQPIQGCAPFSAHPNPTTAVVSRPLLAFAIHPPRCLASAGILQRMESEDMEDVTIGEILGSVLKEKEEDAEKFVKKVESYAPKVDTEKVLSLLGDQHATIDLGIGIFEQLSNPLSYTSCIPSAENLFGLIAKKPKATLTEGTIEELSGIVKTMDGNQTVFVEAKGGEHGFLMVVDKSGDDVEILQSFANDSILINSFAFPGEKETRAERRKFKKSQLAKLLKQAKKEKEAQTKLFGGGVHFDKGLRWRVSPLKVKKTIEKNYKRNVNTRMKSLGRLNLKTLHQELEQQKIEEEKRLAKFKESL